MTIIMKRIPLLFVLILTSLFVQAQSPVWQWAAKAGGNDYDYSLDVAVDNSGNSYITGRFVSPSITFGSITLTNAGQSDIFIVKYDVAGNVVWAKSVGTGANEYGIAIAVDPIGNCYVTGEFGDASITFDTVTLTNAGAINSTDLFIVKYDPAGNVVWAKRAGGSDNEVGNGIAIDGSGNSYVTGRFNSSSVTFGSTTLTNAGGTCSFFKPCPDIFTVKYDPGGNALWAKKGGGNSWDESTGIAVDKNGFSYVTGYFYSPTMNLDTIALANVGNNYDLFIVKYDTSGNMVWAKSAGSNSGGVAGNGIAVDGSGNSYITGEFTSPSLTLGSTTLTNAGGNDVFTVKYDGSGSVVWAKSAGSSSTDYGYGIAVDGSGNSYVAGRFRSLSIVFDTITLTNTGGICSGFPSCGDIFITKYDGSGNAVWAKSANGYGDDLVRSIAVDGSGNTYATGYFVYGSLTLDAITLTNAGYADVLIARLGDPCTASPSQPGTVSGTAVPCPGSSQIYTVPAITSAASYIWTLPTGWAGTSISNSITTTVGATGGNITVAAVNGCGKSPVQSLLVTVNPLPAPTITQSGNTVSVPGSFSSYQWYLSGNAIPGATSSTHLASQNGNYHVVVTDSSGCIGQSDTLNVVITRINNQQSNTSENQLLLAPNPVKDVLSISSKKSIGIIRIYDGLGRKVVEKGIDLREAQIDVSSLANGIYYLRTKGQTAGIKFVKE